MQDFSGLAAPPLVVKVEMLHLQAISVLPVSHVHK